MIQKFFVTALLVCGFAEIAFAYRPFKTEDAGVAPLGENKIELGYEGIRSHDEWLNNMIFRINFGLGRADVLIESPYVFHKDEKGSEGLVVAAKVSALGENEEGGLLTFEALYDIPNDNHIMSILATKLFGIVAVHTHLGYKTDFAAEGVVAGLGLDIRATERFSFIIDNFSEYFDSTHSHIIKAGMIWNVNEKIAIDAAVGYCFIRGDDDAGELIAVAGFGVVM